MSWTFRVIKMVHLIFLSHTCHASICIEEYKLKRVQTSFFRCEHKSFEKGKAAEVVKINTQVVPRPFTRFTKQTPLRLEDHHIGPRNLFYYMIFTRCALRLLRFRNPKFITSTLTMIILQVRNQLLEGSHIHLAYFNRKCHSDHKLCTTRLLKTRDIKVIHLSCASLLAHSQAWIVKRLAKI